MIKIKDRCTLDAEEIKRELMYQIDEYRVQFDKVLAAESITEEERLSSLRTMLTGPGRK